MQGHITKIIKNKPDQNLGLVEEACGTSLYLAKRA
jgi:chromosome segregation ATPase